MTTGTVPADGVREKALFEYRKKLLEHKEVESRLKESKWNPQLITKYILLKLFILFLHRTRRN